MMTLTLFIPIQTSYELTFSCKDHRKVVCRHQKTELVAIH